MNNDQTGAFQRIRSFINRLKDTRPFLFYFIFSMKFRRNYRFNKSRIRGKKNSVVKCYAISNGVQFDIVGQLNCIEIDKWTVLDQVKFHIRGNGNKIIIGSECRIANSIIWVEDNGCEVRIGHQTTIGGVHLAATENQSKVIIGDDCMFASDIEIRTGDSHGIYDKAGQRTNVAKDILIGDHVWIATSARILKGVVIGAGSIIGTSAVVSRGLYPPSCIIAGNPAEVVRKEMKWTRSRLACIEAK